MCVCQVSLIGLTPCTDPQETVESHLNKNQEEFGYSRDNCLVGKDDLLATEIFGCSFVLTNAATRRCLPRNSSVFADSFEGARTQRLSLSLRRRRRGIGKRSRDRDLSGDDEIKRHPRDVRGDGEITRQSRDVRRDKELRPSVSLDSVSGLRSKNSEECPQDCVVTSFTVSPSITPLTESLKQTLRTKVSFSRPVAGVRSVLRVARPRSSLVLVSTWLFSSFT